MTTMQRFLVIDDEHDSGQIVTDAAQAMGITCLATTDAVSFLDHLTPDTTLVFLDLVMPDIDGIELLRILGQRGCEASIVLMSGADQRILETAEEWAVTLGLTVVGHLHKPFRLAELEAMIELSQNLPERRPRPLPTFFFEAPELRAAIDRDEFVLHFQPQVDLTAGKIIGVEALVRWQHPVHGLVFPDDFISRAEQLGLINDLGWIVVNRGLSEINGFTEQTGIPLVLSINVSAYSLGDVKFPDIVLSLLQKHNVSADKLIFEITESGLIQELSNTLDTLTRLRMKHIQLSIDDFGTGYSMLRRIRRVPATELKIERQFVQNLHNDKRDRILVEKTIEIGHELGLRVIAEGVETLEQLAFLRSKNCDVAQGFLFSPALPGPELVEWLKNFKMPA